MRTDMNQFCMQSTALALTTKQTHDNQEKIQSI